MNVPTPQLSSSKGDFESLRTQVALRGIEPLFTTDAENLFSIYLDALPEEVRQHHHCNACRQFLERYGGLVHIGSNGSPRSVFWSLDFEALDPVYVNAVAALENRVFSSKVTGVFYSSEKQWGIPSNLSKKTNITWTHFSAVQTNPYQGLTKNADQLMAEKKEDFKTLSRGLAEFPLQVIEKAVAILQANGISHADKFIGYTLWLKDLHLQIRDTKIRRQKDNLIWRAVASAPAGFCHLRSSVIGSLLEDLDNTNLSFDEVKRRMEARLSPVVYQRPQTAPDEGNIKQAEDLLAKLGPEYQNSFRRRYAKLEEVETIWKPPAPTSEPDKGMFDHLRKRPAERLSQLSYQHMTWAKFRDMVLPLAESIEFQVAPLHNYGAIIAPVDPEAPPILQWDYPEKRNPFSWYFYVHASSSARWNLQHRTSLVTGVCLLPAWWKGNTPHDTPGAMFLLEGARDTAPPGLALFPGILKSDFHAIRKTIEAFSESKRLEGKEEATACGVGLASQPGKYQIPITLLVRMKGIIAPYILDRWD